MVKNNGLCRDLSELLDDQDGHKLQINSEINTFKIMVMKILSKRGIPLAQTGIIVFRVIRVTLYAETEELAQWFYSPHRVTTVFGIEWSWQINDSYLHLLNHSRKKWMHLKKIATTSSNTYS